MKLNRFRWLGAVCVIALCLSAVQAQAAVTNFSTDVATSIDMGISWLDGNGAFNNPSSAGDAAGLVMLALLEKRVSADPDAVTQGYALATPADQARMRRVAAYILNNINITPFGLAYRDGSSLMALALYARTGGPDRGEHPDLPAGLPHDLVSGINTIVDRFGSFQRASGYWCYGLTFQTCDDSSTTQFAVAGLLAAKAFYADAAFADPARVTAINAMLASARTGYVNNGTPGQSPVLSLTERGHGYNVGNTNSLQQTASGTWIQLAGGADVNDASVQGYLEWLRNRYDYPDHLNATGGWGSSWAYYLWSSSKAYEFITSSGIAPNPGNLGPEDIGVLLPDDAPAFANRRVHLDPDTVPRVPMFGSQGAGYYSDPNETARVYFDYAYSLLGLQDVNGRYNNPPGTGNWNVYSRQAYALLVLQRSVGGGCIDSDGDGVCDDEDNCVNTPNPNQEDQDGDGVGDACDNCVNTPNADQADTDNNGVGDACEQQGLMCDLDGDGDVDSGDVRAVSLLRGTTVPPSDPLADPDGNGIVNVNDARACVLQCTKPRCAP